MPNHSSNPVFHSRSLTSLEVSAPRCEVIFQMSNLKRIVDKPILLVIFDCAFVSISISDITFQLECMDSDIGCDQQCQRPSIRVQSRRTRRRKGSACNQITQLKRAAKTKCRSRFVFQRLELQLHVVLPSLHEPSNSRPYKSRRAQPVRPIQVRYPGCGDGLLCQLPENRRVNNGSIT